MRSRSNLTRCIVQSSTSCGGHQPMRPSSRAMRSKTALVCCSKAMYRPPVAQDRRTNFAAAAPAFRRATNAWLVRGDRKDYRHDVLTFLERKAEEHSEHDEHERRPDRIKCGALPLNRLINFWLSNREWHPQCGAF